MVSLRRLIEVAKELNIPDESEDARNIKNLVLVMNDYFEKWDSTRAEEKVLESEISFSLPLPTEKGVTVCGRIDLVVSRGKLVKIRDFKHSTSMGDSFPKRARPNNQFPLYMWAYETTSAGKRVDVAELDGILLAKSKRDFQRVPIMHSQYDAERCLSDLGAVARDIKRKIETQEWDHNTSQCTSYGVCAYRDLCNDSDPEPMIELGFRIEPWEPGAYDR
jgi:hypothetical protein